MQPNKIQQRKDPQNFPEIDSDNIYAIRALKKGTATSAQQIKAMNFIITELCELKYQPYYTDERTTTFMLGKQYVGRLITSILEDPLIDKQES